MSGALYAQSNSGHATKSGFESTVSLEEEADVKALREELQGTFQFEVTIADYYPVITADLL